MMRFWKRAVSECGALWVVCLLLAGPLSVRAQLPDLWEGDSAGQARAAEVAGAPAEEDGPSVNDVLGVDSSERSAGESAPEDAGAGSLNLLQLLRKGGPLMIPIYLMSVLVVTLAIDRFLAVRRGRVLPPGLLDGLNRLAVVPTGFDPRKAYRLAQQHPSAASAVIRSMLLKVGRPQSELERAVSEASEREASRLYSPVRWLNLSAAVAPLFGLLGTVWGMIRAFFDYSQLQVGQNKADFLAEGIYVALVTTFGGLAVAIPAAILAHYFEGRIESIMHQIDEMLFNLIPQVERFEGRLRVTRQSLISSDPTDETVPRSSDGERADDVGESPPQEVPRPMPVDPA